MRRIENIGEETRQRHTILFLETEIILTLQYFPTTQEWAFSAEYKDFSISGIRLAVGVLHMLSSNQPFDFVVRDTSGQGLDPFRLTDWVEGRTELYLLEPDDIAARRGAEVPL